ncbi:unnamed protein product [Ceratitis capitata]|uniref:(Mediterranean fruit fly) hypothetical protein n=1 Tax=Ceratitis capitata TaxID=7213 RepID=A0A811V5W4_CERCA|nr:unnamed protein product [Ceratitis capitata]
MQSHKCSSGATINLSRITFKTRQLQQTAEIHVKSAREALCNCPHNSGCGYQLFRVNNQRDHIEIFFISHLFVVYSFILCIFFLFFFFGVLLHHLTLYLVSEHLASAHFDNCTLQHGIIDTN